MGIPDSFLASVLKDRYQLQQQLGKKPGRRTLLAFDRETQQSVILKVLTFSHDTAWEEVRLFQREAELLQTLSHPSIPKYIDGFDFETAASKGYAIVQSDIKAPSLEDHLQAGRCFSEADVRHILEAVLEILGYLHQRQPPVIHRDIKPSNILLTDRSGHSPGQVYLVDFGSVQTLASQAGKTITVVGTYGYMPPEQFGDVAYPASDLYSLGVTAINLLTRTHPADLPKTGVQIQFEGQVSLTPDFQAWLQCMTEPDVVQRPDSAEAALHALKSPQDVSQIFTSKSNRVKAPMTPTQLLIDATWRSVFWGAMTGAIGFSIFPGFLVLAAMMAPNGAIIGALLGGINGIFIGTWTRLFYFPLTRLRSHRMTCSLLSTVIGLGASIGGSFIALAAFDTYAVGYTSLAVPTVVLIGAAMGMHSSRIINRWYRQRPEPNGSNKNKPWSKRLPKTQ